MNCQPRWANVALGVIAAAALLITLGYSPVMRTQEARVLESSREMLGGGVQGWLIPRLNGEIRLRKPPLAYWLAAGGFDLFGVNDFAGRLPTAIVSWLLLAATYLIGCRLFGSRVGLLAAGCLLSSYLFFRYGRLAETDAPAALGATVAVALFWRATQRQGWGTFHLAAAAVGLSLFAKQGPGFFAILFFVAWALVRRRPKALWQFVISGAPLTLLVVAGWWYGYAAYSRGIAQFKRELAEVAEGIDHPAWFVVYFPMILLATAPWSLLVVGAIVAAIQRARREPALAGLLVWAAATFVPLCFIGNKQEHYLLPLIPPLMLLAGWLIAQAARTDGDAKLAAAARALIVITMIACIASSAALPGAGIYSRGYLLPLDWMLAAFVAVGSAAAYFIAKSGRWTAGALMLACVWAFALAGVLDVWGNTVAPSDIRVTASQISQRFGRGPYVFYGGDTSLPLCFALRQEIPRMDDRRPDLLRAAAEKSPTLAVIWEIPQRDGPGVAHPHEPPPDFLAVGPDVGARGQHFRIYQRDPSAVTPDSK